MKALLFVSFCTLICFSSATKAGEFHYPKPGDILSAHQHSETVRNGEKNWELDEDFDIIIRSVKTGVSTHIGYGDIPWADLTFDRIDNKPLAVHALYAVFDEKEIESCGKGAYAKGSEVVNVEVEGQAIPACHDYLSLVSNKTSLSFLGYKYTYYGKQHHDTYIMFIKKWNGQDIRVLK